MADDMRGLKEFILSTNPDLDVVRMSDAEKSDITLQMLKDAIAEAAKREGWSPPPWTVKADDVESER